MRKLKITSFKYNLCPFPSLKSDLIFKTVSYFTNSVEYRSNNMMNITLNAQPLALYSFKL